MDYSQFKLLSFDTYGTLIDWENGILKALAPLLERCDQQLSAEAALEAFGAAEMKHEHAQPTALYRDILSEVYRSLAQAWHVTIGDEEAVLFGQSVKDWPAFADSPAGLKELQRHFFMVTVTNCDRLSYMGSNARLEIVWDAIYTAQDIGSYKPSQRNFDYLFEHARREFGVFPQEILHVAQSLTHDMVPATRAGMSKVWINRRQQQEGHGATPVPEGEYTLEAEFASIGEFAEEVAAQLGRLSP